MKVGLICALYNAIDYVEKCYSAWIKYRAENPEKLVIICIDTKFKETEDGADHSTDGTLELLKKYKEDGLIDYVVEAPPGLMEHESRNLGLDICKKENCDVIHSIGSDEVYTVEQIKQIYDFVEKKKFIAYFQIYHKNLVFDEKHYTDDFCPNRVWRIKYGNAVLNGFNGDDNCYWTDGVITIGEKGLPSLRIPKNIAFILHYTWCHPKRCKEKIAYQTRRWNEHGCSFKWNEEKDCLEFDEVYYQQRNMSPPEVFVDE